MLRSAAQTRARKQDVPFGLTTAYLISLLHSQRGLCALTGHPLTFQSQRPPLPTAASIDRIIPSRGYIAGNVRIICHIVNLMRSNMTDDDLHLWCLRIVQQNGNGRP